MVAINDAGFNNDNPIIEWPDVQPFAYLVPNPIKKPPDMKNNNPLIENKLPQLNISLGSKPAKLAIPNSLSFATVLEERLMLNSSGWIKLAK